jgi:hypothetical protein
VPPVRFNPSPCPRLQNWTRIKQVIDSETVDVGFDEHHPKEPAAAFHGGVTYVACAVWNRYAQHLDKEVVLCTASAPDDEFTQQCQITDGQRRDGYNHAPGIMIDDGRIWVVYSRSENGNDVYAKHAPVTDIPESPSEWTDAGLVLEDARDPGLVRGPDEEYHIVAKDERDLRPADPGVVRASGPSIRDLSGRETIYTDTLGEAPEIVPKVSGSGYWLVTAEQVGEGPRMSVAGEADTITAQFKGYYCLGTHRTLGGITKPFHDQWTLHHDYLQTDGGQDLYRKDGEVAAFFEGGDGTEFSIGVGFLDDGNT